MPGFGAYAIVGGVAAGVTTLTTPLVRRVAMRYGWGVTAPDPRRVHKEPTPSIGGVAMYLGFVAAMVTARSMPAFSSWFSFSEPWGVFAAGSIIFLVGLADDIRPLSAPAKLTGMVAAGLVLALLGVTLLSFLLPAPVGVVVLAFDLQVFVTVVWVVAMANMVNLIDGLDGLAAGVMAIASASYFVYAQRLTDVGILPKENIGSLVAVMVLGLCLGFLPHNFNPARIFMGDGGALLLGLLMAASTIVVGGRADGTKPYSGQTYFFLAPMIVPLLILGVPLVDTMFAIIRRARRRAGVATADKQHIHHRLMELGHGHRRSVLILWLWTGLLSALVLYPAVTGDGVGVVRFLVLAVGLGLFTVLHPQWRRSRSAGATPEADVVHEPSPSPAPVAESAPEPPVSLPPAVVASPPSVPRSAPAAALGRRGHHRSPADLHRRGPNP